MSEINGHLRDCFYPGGGGGGILFWPCCFSFQTSFGKQGMLFWKHLLEERNTHTPPHPQNKKYRYLNEIIHQVCSTGVHFHESMLWFIIAPKLWRSRVTCAGCGGISHSWVLVQSIGGEITTQLLLSPYLFATHTLPSLPLEGEELEQQSSYLSPFFTPS